MEYLESGADEHRGEKDMERKHVSLGDTNKGSQHQREAVHTLTLS